MARKKDRLVVIGDSHAGYGFGGIAGAEIYWLGAVTMHRVARDGLARVLFDKKCWVGWSTVETAILCFGEIDCRMHVDKIAQRSGQSVFAVIDALVTSYLDSIASYAGRARLCVSCVISPGPNDSEHQDRIRRHLNTRVAIGCAERQFPFIDFYDLDLPRSEDGIHVDYYESEAVCDVAAKALGRNLTYERPTVPYFERFDRRWLSRLFPG